MGNFTPPNRRVDRVFIHCTAYPHGDLMGAALLKAVDSWHKDRGWDKVGYHYLIDRKGAIIPTYRSLEENPIAQAGNNSRTIAICCDGLRVSDFSGEQLSSLAALCRAMNEAYRGRVTFHGHCEVSAKSCPVLPYREILGLDLTGHMDSTAFTRAVSAQELEAWDVKKATVPGFRTLSTTCRGQDVVWLQGVLGCEPDGLFGQDTRKAVVAFQVEHELVPDGKVGSITWGALFEVYGRP